MADAAFTDLEQALLELEGSVAGHWPECPELPFIFMRKRLVAPGPIERTGTAERVWLLAGEAAGSGTAHVGSLPAAQTFKGRIDAGAWPSSPKGTLPVIVACTNWEVRNVAWLDIVKLYLDVAPPILRWFQQEEDSVRYGRRIRKQAKKHGDTGQHLLQFLEAGQPMSEIEMVLP